MLAKIGKYTYGVENIIHPIWRSDLIEVNIGAFTSIAENVSIFEVQGLGHFYNEGTTFPFGMIHTDIFYNHLKRENYHINLKNITIGNDVWIGTGVSIAPGAVIGDGAIIATNSHVVGTIPPYAIYGGNPAWLIKYRFADVIIREFLKLKWWNLPDNKINLILPYLQKTPTLRNFLDINKKLGENL